MPTDRFREGCITQATHSVCCNVSASIERLVVAYILRSLPFCFPAHGSDPMTNALRGVTSMIDDPREDFDVSVDRLDAMQGLCHGTFDGELNICALCSNAH